MLRTLFAVIGLLVVLSCGAVVAGAVFGIAPTRVLGIAPGGGGLTISHSSGGIVHNGEIVRTSAPAFHTSIRTPFVAFLAPLMLLALVLLVGLLLLFGFFALLRRIFSGGRARAPAPGGADRAFGQDEMAVMRELLDGLNRMGQRVESLETILIDRGRR